MVTALTTEIRMHGITHTGKFDTSTGSPIVRRDSVSPPTGRSGERIGVVSGRTVRSSNEAAEEAFDAADAAPRALTAA
jgi:hypothetical protein